MAFIFDPSEPIDASLVSPGWHPATIVDASYKTTRTGGFCRFLFEISGGSSMGRTVEKLLHINHPNPKSVTFSMVALQKISHACGVLEKFDAHSDEALSERFRGKGLRIRVDIKDRDGKEENNISGYEPIFKSDKLVSHPAGRVVTAADFDTPPPFEPPAQDDNDDSMPF